MQKKLFYLATTLSVGLLIGCGGGGGGSSDDIDNKTVYKLSPQTGTQSYLFYGSTNHKALGAIKNIRVIDAANPTKTVVSNDDTTDTGQPAYTTSFEYNATTNSYKDLKTDSLHYVAGKNPYKVPMIKDGSTPTEVANSSESNITGAAGRGRYFVDIDYLGTKQYIIGKNSTGNQILITPEMGKDDAGLPFENKTLLALTYQSFGATADGYIVYDSNTSDTHTKQIQKCTLDMSCTNIIKVDSTYKYIGDIANTTFAALDIDGKYYKLDKSNATVTELVVNTPTPMSGTTSRKATRGAASKYYFNGNSIYFIDSHKNISRYNITTGEHKYISDNNLTDRIRAFTDDLVIYGPTDSEMYAVKKDGTSSEPITLSIATKTKGQKYTYDMAVGDTYIYNLFSVDVDSGKTTFKACLLKDEKMECINDSTWAVVVLAKDGKLNFESSIIYEPYAFIRVDNTDNYGGGTLKAIDPKHPMEDGITLGRTETYNFQTFLTRRDVFTDGNGGIVLYAKNDLDYSNNAYYMNLTKENSLVNLTNEKAPDISEINGNSGHCHGRYCTVCHAFSGGKIYKDKKESGSAIGYNIRYEFQNGETLVAKVRKGEGENFNTPLQNLVGKNFTAVVFNEANGTVVNKSNEYSHRGVEYFNCNFCHGRRGALRHDAPSVISIED
jgi:hypothetical protein